MRTHLWVILSSCLLMPVACGEKDGGDDTGPPGPVDGGTGDGGNNDGGNNDGGTADGGASDGGTSDGGTSDGGTSDGGTSDGGTSDGGTTDGGSTVEDVDEDGYTADEDCDDSDPDVNPGETEICDNGKDDDCDGTPNGCGLTGELDIEDADALIVGRAELAHFGYYSGGRFDLDGDGQGELFLAEHHNDYRDGTGGFFFENPTGDVGVDDAVAQLTSDDEDTWEGGDAASLGDVDGDGYEDIVFGRGLSSFNGEEAGAAFIVLGPIVGAVDIESGVNILGPREGDTLGEGAVAFAGDTDGDGIGEALLGARSADSSGGANAGAAYVVPGDVESDEAQSVGLLASLILHGANASDEAGASVAGAGDIDGDGLDDVIVGAPSVDDGSGAVYIVFGGATGTVVLDSADITLTGPPDDDAGFGDFVAGLGDVDGDGSPDLAVGAPNLDTPDYNAGSAFVFADLEAGSTTSDEAWASYAGVAAVDNAGGCVAGIGDTNGDGLGELAVGATEANSGAGGAWLIRPTAGSWSLDDADLAFVGADGGDDFGATVTGVGDLDGDGLDDVAVGAFRHDATTGSQAGATWILYGTGW